MYIFKKKEEPLFIKKIIRYLIFFYFKARAVMLIQMRYVYLIYEDI